MKRFWIIKKAPSMGRVCGGPNRVYQSKTKASKDCKQLAADEGSTFVVLEVVDGYGPPQNVTRLKIKKGN